MNQELIDFIKNLRNSGQTDDQIKAQLLANGWQEADIYNAFQAAGITKQPLNPVAGPNIPNGNPFPGASSLKSIPSLAPQRIAILGAVVVLNILIITGGVFAYSKYGNKISAKTGTKKTATAKVKKSGGVLDCGKASSEEESKQVSSCMDPKFKACSPAKSLISIDMSALGAGVVDYQFEIVGPDGSQCKMKTQYLKSPNPEYIGKEMVCSYDNSKGFEEASMATMTEANKCSGPLWDVMKSATPAGTSTGSGSGSIQIHM